METLYNHKTNLDNERVTVARKRLEEKYSGATWKLKQDTLNSSLKKKSSLNSNLPTPISLSKPTTRNENNSQLGSSTSIAAITHSPSFKPGTMLYLTTGGSFYKMNTVLLPEMLAMTMMKTANNTARNGTGRMAAESSKENKAIAQIAHIAEGSQASRTAKNSSRITSFQRGGLYQHTQHSKSPPKSRANYPSVPTYRFGSEITSKFTKTTTGEGFLRIK